MLNYKIIIILILILFLILIYKKNILKENFFDFNGDHDHKIDTFNLYIEFYYKDTCDISRQFMYGCCKPLDKTNNKLTDSDYYTEKIEKLELMSTENNSFYPDSGYTIETLESKKDVLIRMETH